MSNTKIWEGGVMVPKYLVQPMCCKVWEMLAILALMQQLQAKEKTGA